MYLHVIVTASIAMGLLSQASIAKPIERLEEKRPVVAAQVKADAKQHPYAYQQVREDALNNPGKIRKVVSAAREHPIATRPSELTTGQVIIQTRCVSCER